MNILFLGTMLTETETDLKVFLWIVIVVGTVLSVFYALLPYLAAFAGIFIIVAIVMMIRSSRKSSKPDPNSGHVKVSKEGVQRLAPGGDLNAIAWEEITSIKIFSQNAQISKEGAFLALENESLGKSVVIPMSNPNMRYILPRIASFHGFSKETMAKALASKNQGEHLLWQRGS